MLQFGIKPDKEAQLQRRMTELGIREGDLVERFIRGSGAGGQKINKTSSCVYILHKPTGIEVKCQRERLQSLNRYLARRELCDRVEAKVRGVGLARQQEAERIRRQKRRRSRRQKARMLDEKKKQGAKKAQRRSVSNWDSA
ncbi:MAG TPA: peptide chain release factor-like protein [Kiritimatiellia bacterium]|nr:peptide chain release factor-like protein [Kiritimatiellia bacterium]